MSVIVSNDGSQWKKPTAITTAGAIAAGSMAQGIFTSAGDLCVTPIMGKMRSINKGTDKVIISQALKDALEKSGLKDKVELVEFSSKNNYKNLAEFYKDFIKNFKTMTPLERFSEMNMGLFREGFNAGFSPILNQVLINTEKMGLAGFHEIGHAINFNNSKFWKGLHLYNAVKMPMALTTVLSLTALFKRKKAEGEQVHGLGDKTATFIKNNVGKLTLLTMIPVVAEEIKATLRGNKLAKELLSPENYNKVVKSNRLGAITYVLLALFMSGGAYLANRIKDSIAKPTKVSE